MCFRRTITLSTQNATAQGPDGEYPFLTDRAAARASQSRSEAQTAVRFTNYICMDIFVLNVIQCRRFLKDSSDVFDLMY